MALASCGYRRRLSSGTTHVKADVFSPMAGSIENRKHSKYSHNNEYIFDVFVNALDSSNDIFQNSMKYKAVTNINYACWDSRWLDKSVKL